MRKYLLIAFVILLLVGAGAVWFRIGDPKWVVGIIMAAVTASIPWILKALRPKDLTPEQIEQARAGEDYHSTRPYGRQKGE